FVPYVGAVILVVVVLVIVGFMNYIVGIAGMAVGAASMVTIFVPPVILNCYLMGLVAGKVSSERVSAGFKHAVLLMLISLVAMAATPHLVKGLAIKL
ncbi:MAG: secretion system protein, partial [Thermoprotei archaeon]